MTNHDLPITADELRAIADALDAVEAASAALNSPLIGRIEVLRPDSSKDDRIGWMIPYEGWWGYIGDPADTHG